MTRFITIIALLSACYVVSASKDWRDGKSKCEICSTETEAFLVDVKLARNQHLPRMIETCGEYPTADGACDSLIQIFNYTYDTLESRLDAEQMCASYGVCNSTSTVDISDPAIPTAPVATKDPSKVYDRATCRACTVTAQANFLNVGNYAVRLNGQLENNCLDFVKADMVPSHEEAAKCTEFMSNAYDKLTNTLRDKSNVDYLCIDLFDVCPAQQ